MLLIAIYLTCFGSKEPEDEQLFNAVLTLFNTYMKL